jgi:hypothetical protein
MFSGKMVPSNAVLAICLQNPLRFRGFAAICTAAQQPDHFGPVAIGSVIVPAPEGQRTGQ